MTHRVATYRPPYIDAQAVISRMASEEPDPCQMYAL